MTKELDKAEEEKAEKDKDAKEAKKEATEDAGDKAVKDQEKKKHENDKANEKKAEEDEKTKNHEDKTWRDHLDAAKKEIDAIKAETAKKYKDPKVQIPGLRARADMPFEELKESLVDKAKINARHHKLIDAYFGDDHKFVGPH